jgi:hypothetical protein
MDPALSTSVITCSTTLLPYHDSEMRSYTFLDISIPSVFLSERGGVNSVTVATLLAALRKKLYVGDGVPAQLADIIMGLNDARDIIVATTQVPAFDVVQVEDPIHGYRTLGSLSFVEVQFEIPPSTFDCRRDVLAVHSNDNPKTDLFYRKWRPCQLRLENHFILVFNNISSPKTVAKSQNPFSFPYNMSHANDTPLTGSPSGYQTPSPMLNHGMGDELGLSVLGKTSCSTILMI